MAIDTPARLAILGAGPVGLEAALYARFLGYDVVIYEQGEIAEAIRRSSDLRMSAPFRVNHSSLGLAAIQAQDESYPAPDLEAYLTGREWIESYLAPLAATDLVSDHLWLRTTVLAVEIEESPQSEMADGEEESERMFRVQSCNAGGERRAEEFAGVLDCTGVANPVKWLGVYPESTPGTSRPFQTSEPNFYVLGSKSRPGTDFLFHEGLTQIREVFAIIGDRATLDLYAGAKRLIR